MANRKRNAPGSRGNSGLNRKRASSNKEKEDANANSTSSKKRSSTKKNKHKLSPFLWGPSPQLLYGILILMVAMAMGILWNLSAPIDPKVQTFWKVACGQESGLHAKCKNGVVPTRRTLQSLRPLRAGERLLEIPRSMQLWDIDAMRDERVQELFPARHPRTGNALAPGAFLAAWLALQLQQVQQIIDPIRKSYLELLPLAEELDYHPVFWGDEYLASMVGGHSMAYSVALSYRDMVDSEYDAFRAVSSSFAEIVNETHYKTARVNVLARSFSPGPPGSEEAIDTREHESFEKELHFYRDQIGRPDYFKDGCHAMVPFLDLLNHHPRPNVAYSYDKQKRAFIISAKTSIPATWEFMDSYGKFTDAHLFGKFGFVNGDGSSHTQATIALFHRVLDLLQPHEFSYLPYDGSQIDFIQRVQRKGLLKYLQYDDGYESCIEGPEQHPEEFHLKQLKLKHLEAIANIPRRWVVHMGPRESNSYPLESSQIPISMTPPEVDPLKLKVDVSDIVATCRLMSLTTSDYEGQAIQVLTENLGNLDFVVQHGDDALEYRALMCLARLSSTSFMQFKVDLNSEMSRVRELNKNEFQTTNWTVAQVRLGEMQTLNSIAGIAFAHIKKWEEQLENPTSAKFTIRDQSCPQEYVDALVEDTRLQTDS